ncbi:TM116 protein, partial [Polyodon spathula]|nr:TM116 protein [Polyodon spathula]
MRPSTVALQGMEMNSSSTKRVFKLEGSKYAISCWPFIGCRCNVSAVFRHFKAYTRSSCLASVGLSPLVKTQTHTAEKLLTVAYLIRPLFYLSFTDLLLGVSWLVGAVLYREPLGSQNVACYNLQSIGQIFYVSSFFYTINYTWVLYTDLKEKYNRTVNGFSQVGSNHAYRISRIMTILSGVIPVLLMAPVFWGGNVAKCYQNFSQPYKCLLMHTGTLEPDTGYNESDTKVCHAMHYYGIAVVLETVKLFNPTGQEKFYVSLYILQAFTSASQGILNCFVYGFTQHMIRFMKNKTSRDVDTQTPLLRSQKKCYASRHSISTGTSQTTG